MPAAHHQQYDHEEDKILHLSESNENVTAECICPKCGIHHKMKILWTGRGKPKKFCQPCKTFVTTIEQIDACGVPPDIHRGIEKII